MFASIVSSRREAAGVRRLKRFYGEPGAGGLRERLNEEPAGQGTRVRHGRRRGVKVTLIGPLHLAWS